jgi:hypothetical protein
VIGAMVAAKTATARKPKRAKADRVLLAKEPDAEGMFRGSDMGAPLQIRRGAVEYSAQVHVPDDPDDKRSLTRVSARAQKVWAPDRLYRAGSIGGFQWQAAHKIYNDYSIGEEGARTGPTDMGTKLDPWARLPFSERRAMCRQAFRSAVRAAGPRFSTVLVFCVLQQTGSPDVPPTCEAYAKMLNGKLGDGQDNALLKWTTDKASMWLAAALEVLAVHYGFSRHPASVASQAPRSE